jgi:hypothetical protein
MRRHGRALDAIRDNGAKVGVRKNAFELAAAQIHAGNLVPAEAVAARALSGENSGSVLDIGLRIRANMILSLAARR